MGDSVEKVQNGTRLVNQAGNTMRDIMASVKSVTQISRRRTTAHHGHAEIVGKIRSTSAYT
jgi:methyl-accepting chemotaxis protein